MIFYTIYTIYIFLYLQIHQIVCLIENGYSELKVVEVVDILKYVNNTWDILRDKISRDALTKAVNFDFPLVFLLSSFS